MEYKKKQIAAYLMDKVGGGMIGVNSFGLLVAELFQQGRTIEAIIEFCAKNLKTKHNPDLGNKISQFIKQLEACKLTPDRLRILKRYKKFQVLNAQLDLSWKCNLSCRHCYLGDKTLLRDPLELSEWKMVLDQLYAMNVPKITFLGGEPLLAKNFFTLARYAFDKGFKLFTTTNGTLVSPHLAKEICNAGFNEIDVSLDGASAEAHEFLRGENTFDSTLRGIGHLVSSGISVKTATVLSKMNCKDIGNLLRLGGQLGVEQMYFNPLLPGGQGNTLWHDYALDFDRWIKVKDAIKSWNQKGIAPKAFAESSFDFLVSLRKDNIGAATNDYAGCKAGKREFILTPDGFAVACPLLTTKREFHTMNVRDYPLTEIWEKDRWIVELRNINEHTKGGKCQNCHAIKVCQGGCHILALLECGDIHETDPRCPHASC